MTRRLHMGREHALTCSSVTLVEGDEVRPSWPDGVTSLCVCIQNHGRHAHSILRSTRAIRRTEYTRETRGLVLQWLALACFAGLRLLLFLAAEDSLRACLVLPRCQLPSGSGVSGSRLTNCGTGGGRRPLPCPCFGFRVVGPAPLDGDRRARAAVAGLVAESERTTQYPSRFVRFCCAQHRGGL